VRSSRIKIRGGSPQSSQPEMEEETKVDRALKTDVPTRQEQQEIEAFSRRWN